MAEDAPRSRERARPATAETFTGTGEKEQAQETGTGLRQMGMPLPSFDDMRRSMTPERLLWYGGLGTLAAFGVIDWPVAAVVGAGAYVAKRMAKREASAGQQARS